MAIRRAFSLLVPALAAALPLAACDDDGGSSMSSSSSAGATSGAGGSGGETGMGGGGGEGGAAAAAPVTLRFEGRVGAEVFSCGSTFARVGASAAEVRISDFRLYIHDLRLHRTDGESVPVTLDQDGKWQLQDLVLLDFEDKSGSCANGTTETNAEIHGTAPPGQYDGLSFKLGVPFALNHGDAATAPSPLNLSGLFWNWNGGYKFLRVDSAPAAGGGAFNLHVGSTGCMADGSGAVTSCDRPNVAEIALTGFDPLSKKVLVDYAAVVSGSDVTTDAGGAPGCMSGATDPECAPIFERLGIELADGSTHPEMQTLFRVE
jgi:uncharacterized repeat protein (TIGR04052 family)